MPPVLAMIWPPSMGLTRPDPHKAENEGRDEGGASKARQPGIAYCIENDVEIAESGEPSGGLSFFDLLLLSCLCNSS